MATIVGGGGGATHNGNDAENDSIWGAGGGDTIRGGPAAGTGGGNDFLDGGDGSDLIYGGAGNDTLIGGEGGNADTIYGGTGTDTADYSRFLTGLTPAGVGTFTLNTATAVNVNLATTSVSGGFGADRIFEVENVIGGGGADTITGNDGLNLLDGGAGADSISGGLGNDTLVGGAGVDTLYGGNDGDLAYGGTEGDLIYGDTGADTLFGEAGVDTLFGGADADLAYGGNDADLLYGDSGNDTLSGDDAADTVYGGSGEDNLSGGAGTDQIFGGFGNDTIASGTEDDTVFGGAGNDTVDGGTGADVIYGGPDPATSGLQFNWSDYSDEQDLALGVVQDVGGINVTVSYTGGFTGATFSAETTGSTGGGEREFPIYVGSGEPFNANSSAEFFRPADGGGSTSSTVQFDFAATAGSEFQSSVQNLSFRISDVDRAGFTDAVTVRAFDINGVEVPVTITVGSTANLSLSGNTVTATGGGFLPNSVEGSILYQIAGPAARVVISYTDLNNAAQAIRVSDLHFDALPNLDNDSLLGGDGSDTIYGGAGLDTILGAIGDDRIYGGLGSDSIDAGDGADIVYGDDGNDNIQFGTGADTVFGGAGNDIIDDLTASAAIGANLIYGGDGNDLMWSGNDADTLYGDSGNDTMSGEVGNDLLFGGLDNDQLFGGSDLDTLYGDVGDDTVQGDSGADLLYGGDNSDVAYGGLGADTVFGDTGTDTLYGGDNGDLVYGGADLDTVYGDAGADTLFGDAGVDNIFGGLDNDLAYGGTEGDRVAGDEGDDTLYGDAGADTLYGGDNSDLAYGGSEADLVYGGAGLDTLFGDAGNDTLSGDAGNDVLSGGVGNDAMFGGADRDLFNVGYNLAYNSVLAANDVANGEIVDGGNGGVDNDTLRVDITGLGWGRIDLVYDPLNAENGTITFFNASGGIVGTLAFTEIENLVIVCFTAGTRILTDRGPVAVETLVPGDMVVTRDRGLQPLRWVGMRTLSYAELQARPNLQPVRIGIGAISGAGPEQTMLVSPQHRLLIEGARAEMYFGESEVLVPAKHLTGMAEVTRALPSDGVTYVHILFDRHEIVQSDGIWTESFQPAERTLNALEDAARAEVLELFPELAGDSSSYPAARLTLKAHEARVLLSD